MDKAYRRSNGRKDKISNNHLGIEWHSLAALANENFKELPKASGIYVVRWVKDAKPVSIGRLRKVDRAGIMYIGSTTGLNRRIRQVWKAVNGDTDSHTMGKTVVFCGLSRAVRADEYEISWEKVGGRMEARGQEWNALKMYCDRFGEPPPLNLKISREAFAIAGLARAGAFRGACEDDSFVRSVISSESESKHHVSNLEE